MSTSDTTRRRFLGVLGGGLAVAGGVVPALSGTASAETGPTVLAGATLIDGTGGVPRRDSTVVLAGDRIVAVCPRSVPPGARVLDLRGKYLIPGLWDLHVHSIALDRVYPPLYVANGVTGIREMFGHSHPTLPDLRDRVESGRVIGPRMVIGSTIVDGPGSVFGPVGAEVVTTEAEARAVVHRAAEQGADFVKVYSFLRPDTHAAIADECARLGLPFAGHLPERISAGPAAALGQRTFEHLFGMYLSTSGREAGLRAQIEALAFDPADPYGWIGRVRAIERSAVASHNRAKAAALFARLRRLGAWQSPTLTVLRVFAQPADAFDWADPRLRYLPSFITQYWRQQIEATAPRTPELIAEHRDFLRAELRLVGAMHRAGVGVVAGTDANNPFCFPGFGLHDELALLVEAGLSPMAALLAATRDAARCLGLEHRHGTVAPGKAADLVVLDADPLADIANTTRIHGVVARGRWIRPAERTRLLADIARAAAEAVPPGQPVAACGCQPSVLSRNS
ncbi:amidohydrolase family protein [Actinokineospora sp.]|uniref:amidohydrolase family protein n=1 Tax=Actinokineospora sp. TaxID=1872133 RepID=UPI004037A897